MQLIVAEKPSVARDLARVLGVRPSGEHSFEGNGRVITWCIGHLVELDEPAAYDARWKSWRLETLPMVPAEFRLRPSRHAAAQLRAVTRLLGDRRFASVVNACDAGREGELIFRYVVQFAGRSPPVQRLWISSLTDEAIRKGFAALRPGAQLDPLADAARSRSEADWLVGMNATRAITARGRAAGDDALYSIGRVQTPTLAMLVRREQAIRAFVPRPYWEVRGTFTTGDGGRFTAGWRGPSEAPRRGPVSRLASAALAGAIVARDAAHGAAADPLGPRVERVRSRTVREPPPLLFDLTALQRTANRRFGMSAARTLDIAQALYERHKVITYPRTDSRHLSSDMVRELPALFTSLAAVPDYAGFAGPLIAQPPRPGRRIVDDGKVHDHHAIIPTDKMVRPEALDRDAWRLFDLIARRFLGAFYPDAEFAVTEAWITAGGIPALQSKERANSGPPPAPAEDHGAAFDERGNGTAERSNGTAEPDDGDIPVLEALPPPPDRYLARGRVRTVAGWQAVAGIDAAAAVASAELARGADGALLRSDHRDDASGGPPQPLPVLREGQPLDGAFASIAKQTTPPRRHTEATLLSAMESAGKAIDDEALRLAMKDTGLGTPATRAAIIETLLTRDYVARARQDLVPTARGIALIDALPVASLASPELTGSWEARLARIARGQDSRAAFMADIARYVADTVDAIRGASPPAAPPGGSGGTGSPAAPHAAARGPRRWQRRRAGGKRAGGTGGAGSSGQRRSAGGTGGTTRGTGQRRGTRSTGDAPRSTGDDLRSAGRTSSGGRRKPRRAAAAPARPTVARASAPAAIPELACPRCGVGRLITGSRGWGCARWREGCRFVVWFETAGRRLTPAQLRDLITRGKTRKARFRSERGSELAGRLVLDPAAEGGARLVADDPPSEPWHKGA